MCGGSNSGACGTLESKKRNTTARCEDRGWKRVGSWITWYGASSCVDHETSRSSASSAIRNAPTSRRLRQRTRAVWPCWHSYEHGGRRRGDVVLLVDVGQARREEPRHRAQGLRQQHPGDTSGDRRREVAQKPGHGTDHRQRDNILAEGQRDHEYYHHHHYHRLGHPTKARAV